MPVWFSTPMLIVLIGVAAFGTGAYKFFGSEPVALLVGGVFMMIIDGALRAGGAVDRPAIDPEVGGHLYFIPGWLWGALVVIGGIYCMVTGTKLI